MAQDQTAALVTGAAQGIGKSIAEKFSADSNYDRVICIDVNEEVESIASQLPGGQAYVGDVSDYDRMHSIIDDVESETAITAAVNNAGFSRHAWIGDLQPDDWDEIVDVNLKGQYIISHAVGPRMYNRKSGTIVNISSGAGTRGSVSGGVHYSASKAGVLGLTKGLAKQLSPHVRVNSVIPGLIKTEASSASEDEESLWSEKGLDRMRQLILLQRRGEPEEVANVVSFLCSDKASYVTGTTVRVDGGGDLMPTQEFLMGNDNV